MEMHKDVPIGEHKYRIGRLPARTGAWILQLILKQMQGSLTEADHANIQSHLLSVCSRLKNGVPLPVLQADGTFAEKDLEFDLNTVVKLQGAARDFNFDDFFAERAREIKEAKARALSSDSSSE
ncbi:MAG TPA: hypothetical protein VGM02_01495 [Acidobacteriaceae bacterium]|jgi:hypothetical protein